MKIAHYCSGFSRLSETFIYDVITELENQRMENIVFTNERLNHNHRPFDRVVVFEDKDDTFIEKGINKLLLKMRWRTHKEVWLKRRQQKLHGLLKKHTPHLMHCHFAPQGCAALPGALRLNIPVLVSFHGFDAFRLPKSTFWKAQYQLLFQSATAITVVSQMMKSHLVSLGCKPDKIHIIHVGKRLSEYSFKKSATLPLRRFLSIGRMEEKKGHLDAIRVFARLAITHPDLRLKIIGSGSLLQQAHNLVTELQVQNVVNLTGELGHSEVKKELDNADAFILCSKTAASGDKEGIPTVLMEAQAIGLPCVSTLHSGIAEVMPEENKWLLGNEGDVHGLSHIVERLINTPEAELEQMRRLGRDKIEQEFNLEKETEKLMQLYKTIAK